MESAIALLHARTRSTDAWIPSNRPSSLRRPMVIAYEVVFLPRTTSALTLWETGLSLLQGSDLLEDRYEISGSAKPQDITKVSRALAELSTPLLLQCGREAAIVRLRPHAGA